MSLDREMIRLDAVTKTFVMHLRGGARLPVVSNVAFAVRGGECVVLGGPSGTGKSSILKMIYGNYRADGGRIDINGPTGWVDIARAVPRAVLTLRQSTIGYVSQFLRVIPRIGALDIVASSAREITANPLRAQSAHPGQTPGCGSMEPDHRILHRASSPWNAPTSLR